MNGTFRSSLYALLRPIEILKDYRLEYLRPDLLAGLTVAIIALPQGIAFAAIAGLPPQVGIYSIVIGAIVGALWGSSNHLSTGPTNTASLLVFGVLAPLFVVGSQEYIVAAGILAVMVGLFRLTIGLARMGILTNFVSDSVVVGFTAGAGALIAVGQIRHVLRVSIERSSSIFVTIDQLIAAAPDVHIPSLILSLSTILLLFGFKRFVPKWPAPLVVMVLGILSVFILQLDRIGVLTIGEFPSSFPPVARLPLFDLGLLGQLSSGALAISAIGLVEAASIARSISSRSGQRIDANQEFVGQGLANLAAGLFSGYSGSASFNRSAANMDAGAQTPLASVFTGIFVLIMMLTLAPAAAYIPTGVLAGVLIVIAYNMIDRKEMVRIAQSSRPDLVIMITTVAATLLLPLEFAVLAGIMMSLAYYVVEKSTPTVMSVVPTEDFKHFLPQPDRTPCPQLGIITVQGDFYFGAVTHVEDTIRRHLNDHPDQLFLLMRLHNVNHIDISGIHMLESLVRAYRERGGDLYFVKTKQPVYELMESTGFVNTIGEDHFLDEDGAISHLFYHVLDPTVCIYECEARTFLECQDLPKMPMPTFKHLPIVSGQSIRQVLPRDLWQELRMQVNPPQLIDVRESREFERGHIPGSQLLPLSNLDLTQVPQKKDMPIVLICRSGRRSRRAAQVFMAAGFSNVRNLEGGIAAWEANDLLEAVTIFEK